MKYRLENSGKDFERTLMMRMQPEIENAKNEVITGACNILRKELESITAKYGIEISSYHDDYDMCHRIRIELVVPEEKE